MGRKKTTPPPKTKVVVDEAKTIKPTHANADARFARVSPDTAMALDFALDRIREIESVNPLNAFRDPEGNIRERLFVATWTANEALTRIRYGADVLIRRDAE